MAHSTEFRMPTFAEQQAILRRAEALRAEAIADMLRALRGGAGRLFGAPRAAAH